MLIDLGLAYRRVSQALQELGRSKEATESIDKAVAAFQEATELVPEDARAHFLLGLAHRDLDHLDEAEIAFRRTLELESEYVEALRSLGLLLGEQGRYEKALPLLEQAAELSPDDATTFHALGMAYQKLNRWQGAVGAFERVVELVSEDVEALWQQGVALCSLEQYEESLGAFDHVLRLNPNLARAWGGKGETLRFMGQYEESLAAFDRALELDSNYTWAWEGKVETLRQMKRYEEALAILGHTLELDPDSTWAWVYIGLTQYLLGKTGDALEAFEEAVRRDESDSYAHNNLGFLLLGEERYKDGIDEINCALELGYDSIGIIYNNLGYAYLMLGDLEQARAILDTVIKEVTDDHTAILRLVFYQSKFHLVERPPHPTKYVSVLVTAYCNLATVLARQGDFEAALVICRRATEKWPDDPTPHQAIGHICLEMENFKDALQAFERASQLDPEEKVLTDLIDFTHTQLASGCEE
jgi:tetratricopeptide (TPR) repeat protein